MKKRFAVEQIAALSSNRAECSRLPTLERSRTFNLDRPEVLSQTRVRRHAK
jgi:hypothetical protein